MNIAEEIKKRRTFAIISHPDAGKTTLTEKFLLYGGAINLAGTVKGRKGAKHAVSDWMEIEKERGISVTSSVLQFNYDGFCINILDTPGHQDFSEDTYRTLMAADSAVMVIDGSKGVEAQTIKLFKVCVMRHIPIFTFVNKMDREARDPFELMDEIEEVLGIRTCPVNWPIGCGREFKGVYDRFKETITTFRATTNGQKEVEATEVQLGDAQVDAMIGESYHKQLMEDIELLDGASDELDMDRVGRGDLSPVFFGSALTNFGVETFLQHFLQMTTSPLPRLTTTGVVDPFEEEFSAFVFKIQANMNKAHRDRVAFMRIVSGKFDAGMEVNHVQGNKKMRLSQPQQIMAQDRKIVEEAYAGDIIGVFDPGIFSIGDTLCKSNEKFEYEGIPTFAPEHFARVRQMDTMKRKQFIKGVNQIAQEGAIQIFQEFNTGMEEIIVGVVGELQFEVLTYRLENEYNVEVRLEKLPYEYIRWIVNKEELDVAKIQGTSDMKRIKDLKDNPLLLFVNSWSVGMVLDRNPGLKLSEFGHN
ncbi:MULTISPECIES: peptide chain release factor 3 [Clostridia]|uniref:Peptide chain release factor 3 n=1 Tax=Lacrimispora celerecrescens TaxID=29354 RepID=A0A084JN52_9FIRM|nr:peptide chain release factor 3 [Lacrimispora celerecrescens]KEZ90386.1 peptide chain release factor 3 [Lacrimispora celerecrescens]MBW4845678.1 peptide chain release factor 3 [Lachnospiraceae bacterium]MSS07704.1 peptide chain release factor 3 [Clostridium sp. WB02_MRS01]CUX65405.1 Peptide chain release factor 3 [Clostridium sp. C105KSO15]